MPNPPNTILADHFFELASDMRDTFDQRLGATRSVSRTRFVWDYWHVPEQYTYVRTFAQHFFPEDLYGAFLGRLRQWGRDRLGCDQINSMWLSYYVSGCHQELHADVPHGPWAYVFSLTDWDNRAFSGGETMLLKPECLDFWRRFDPADPLEANSLVELIAPSFNRLTVFDPRIPHGVRPVHGTMDPLRSRVVLHGWFGYPSPIVSKSLESELSAETLDSARDALERKLKSFEEVTGVVTGRLNVDREGKVEGVRILSNTLISKDGRADRVAAALARIQDFWENMRFSTKGWVILPVRLPAESSERTG